MTRKSDKSSSQEHSHLAEEVAGPLHEHLRMTEQVIGVLRKEISRYRKQNDELIEERNELLKHLAHLQAIRGVRDNLENDLNLAQDERNRLASEIRSLQEQNREIELRCSQIEGELAEERYKHAEARELIVCLEEQIEQLEAIADALRGHEEFVQGLD